MKAGNLKIFERYLNQEMGEEESGAFEASLAEDLSLKAEFEEYKRIYDAISDQEVLNLRRELKKISGSVRQKPGTGRFRGIDLGWFWLAALLIISLSVVSVTYLWVNSPLSSQFQGMLLGSKNMREHIYTLEPAFEELFRYRVRSEDFILDQPKDSAVMEKNSEIRFIWHNPSAQDVFFDVLNRNGRIVFTSGRPVESPFHLDRSLQRGVYIYRFRTTSRTLHMGLFYIV